VIFEQRREIMGSDDLHGTVVSMREEVVAALMARTVPEGTYADHWDLNGLKTDCRKLLGVDLPIHDWAAQEGIGPTELAERVDRAATEHVAKKYAEYGEPVMRQIERNVLLQILDQTWKEHLLTLDQLRQGINLRAYGQRDPLNEYKREAFNLFEAMLDRLRETVTMIMSQVEVRQTATPEQFKIRRAAPLSQETRTDPADPNAAPATNRSGGAVTAKEADRRAALPADALPTGWRNTPRNAPCPCGSGRKFKHCHGKLV
jgi:preprotein translocase subunit SecA